MSDSKIEWTNKTWNPVRGCTRVSEGCRNCYAEAFGHRYSGPGKSWDGFVRDRRWTGRVELVPSKLNEPLSWQKPQRVFTCSMSDLFHESLSDDAITKVFAVMAAAPRHTFQVLTKRPERMREWMQPGREEFVVDRWAQMYDVNLATEDVEPFPWPLPNVWVGTSVEDRKTMESRVPVLREVLAAKRFLSIEPLLEDLGQIEHMLRVGTRWHLQMDISGALRNRSFHGIQHADGKPMTPREAEAELLNLRDAGWKYIRVGNMCETFDSRLGCPGHRMAGIDWVIVGGESGPGARTCNVDWIQAIVDQCKTSEVACFVKQLGAKAVVDAKYIDRHGNAPVGIQTKHPKGGDPDEWPTCLRVRQFPDSVHVGETTNG